MGWVVEFGEKFPALAGVALCLSIFAALVKAGFITVGKRNKHVMQETESGRRRAIAIRNLLDEHVEMPGKWIGTVRAESKHQAGSVLQGFVNQDFNPLQARVGRIEPTVDELRADSKEMQKSITRLEMGLEGVRDGLAEVKADIERMEEAATERSNRTHEMLGTLLNRRI